MAAEERPVDTPFVPHPFSAVPAPDSTAPYPDPVSAVPLSVVPSAPAAPVAPVRRRRRILLPVIIVLLCLLFVGGGVGLIAYNRATAIDRSSPAVVVQQFLRATLVNKDLAQAGLFVCQAWSVSDAVKAESLPLAPGLYVSWGDTTVSETGDQAVVDVRVLLSVPAGSSGGSFRDLQPWKLNLVQQDGWRVCGLERGASLNP